MKYERVSILQLHLPTAHFLILMPCIFHLAVSQGRPAQRCVYEASSSFRRLLYWCVCLHRRCHCGLASSSAGRSPVSGL